MKQVHIVEDQRMPRSMEWIIKDSGCYELAICRNKVQTAVY